MVHTREITTGWEDEDGESYRITLSMTPGEGPTRDGPGCGPELDVISVREDKPGGVERPDLIPVVEAELSGGWGDEVACEAQEAEGDRLAAAMEDSYDAIREERALGGRP